MRHPSDWTDAERRAVALFATYLRSPRRSSREFAALVHQHPDLAEPLHRLALGNRLLDRAVHAHRSRKFLFRRRLGWGLLVAAMLTIVAVGISRLPTAEPSPVSIAARETAQAFAEAVANCLPPGSAGADPSLTPARVDSLAMLQAAVRECSPLAARDGSQPVSGAGSVDIDNGLRESLSAEQLTRFQAVTTADPARWPEDFDAHLMLIASARMQPLDPAQLAQLPPAARELYRRVFSHQRLRLRVIDLDAGGRETDQVDVFIQRISPPRGEIGPAEFVGHPPQLERITPGDLQITVVEPATGRFAQLRVPVFPAVETPPQLAFLRKSAAVTTGMVFQPACVIGYGAADRAEPSKSHLPASLTRVDDFYIDAYEVTVAEYGRFLADLHAHPQWLDFGDGIAVAPGAPPKLRLDGQFDAAHADDAVVGVTWQEANLYANWAGKRLPTDREWERCAEGEQGRIYPWGDDFDPAFVELRTRPPWVGSVHDMPGGATREDGVAPVFRLSDNAEEWVADVFVRPDPSRQGIGIYCPGGAPSALHRCCRGGSSFMVNQNQARIDRRGGSPPAVRAPTLGFRCARSGQHPDSVPH